MNGRTLACLACAAALGACASGAPLRANAVARSFPEGATAAREVRISLAEARARERGDLRAVIAGARADGADRFLARLADVRVALETLVGSLPPFAIVAVPTAGGRVRVLAEPVDPARSTWIAATDDDDPIEVGRALRAWASAALHAEIWPRLAARADAGEPVDAAWIALADGFAEAAASRAEKSGAFAADRARTFAALDRTRWESFDLSSGRLMGRDGASKPAGLLTLAALLRAVAEKLAGADAASFRRAVNALRAGGNGRVVDFLRSLGWSANPAAIPLGDLMPR